jgi:hypothetical protein
LQGLDAEDIRRFFKPSLLEYLEIYKNYEIYGSKQGLIITSSDKQLNITEIHTILQFSEGVLLRLLI